MGWWRHWAGHWRSGDCSTAVSRRYCSWTGTQVLQYYACLLPLVDISHPHAAVLLFYNITLFQTVSQWRVFLTKPRPLHPQPGAARRPALPGADRKCFVTKLNPIVNYLSPFPPFPLPVAPLLSPYNASLLSLKMYLVETYFTRTGDRYHLIKKIEKRLTRVCMYSSLFIDNTNKSLHFTNTTSWRLEWNTGFKLSIYEYKTRFILDWCGRN